MLQFLSMRNEKKSEFDFDLPVLENLSKAKPRVHNFGESTCTSCEG